MDNITQRSCPKVRFQLEDSQTVIHSDLKTSLMEPPVSLRTIQRLFKTLAKRTFKDQKGHRTVRLMEIILARNILCVKKLQKKNPKHSVWRFHQAFPSHNQRFTESSRSIWNSGMLFLYGCPIFSMTTKNAGKWSAIRVY